MKVTANIADKIIEEVKDITQKSTITEAITVALNEWINLKRIGTLNIEVLDNPLEFQTGYSASRIRETNREK